MAPMIKSASEMLAAFIAAEIKEVEAIPMEHMPTLGAAYEAIISSGIDRQFVLPSGLDLRVVSGFIKGLKNQIDCMLVRGEGEQYGRTDQFIYHIDQVLCVLEVKKTMSKADLLDGIGHLADVQRYFVNRFVERFQAEGIQDFEHARETFSKLTGRAPPSSAHDLDTASVEDRLLFVTLARQMHAPATILLGFGGYGTEHGLREALVDILEADIGTKRDASPELLPSLISVGDLCLIKCNGQPYIALDGTDRWVAISSTRHNSALVLIEFLWTKIALFCNVRMPFGPQVEVETLDCVLTAKGVQKDGLEGWEWRSTTKKEAELKSRPASVPWEPIILSRGAISLTNLLFVRGGSLELDEGLSNYLKENYEQDLSTAAAELVRTCAFRIRDKSLHAVEPAAFVATLPDGTGFAGPKREPLEIWCSQQKLDPTFMTLLKFE